MSLPPHAQTPEFLRAFLPRFGVRRTAEDFLVAVGRLVGTVKPVPGRPHRYAVGEGIVVVEAGRRPEVLASRIESGWLLEGDPTAHRVAVALVLA